MFDHEAGREVLAPGARGNVLQLHHDLPNDADAWDVDQGTFDRAVELTGLDSLEVVEDGPVRVDLGQVVYVSADSTEPRVGFG